ncbi:hypothetical protein HDV63DRAFT_46391 [Trichoderma sp. SZMC 28014]
MIQQTVFCFPVAGTVNFLFLSFVVNKTLSLFAKGTLCFVTLCVTTKRRAIYEKSRIYTTLTTFVPTRSKQRQKRGERGSTLQKGSMGRDDGRRRR